MPVIVTELDVTDALGATPVWFVKLNAFGVVSATLVVLVKVPLTPPIVKVVVTVVLNAADAACRTQTDSFGRIVPDVTVNGSVQPTLNSPPDTLTGAPVFVPEIVTALDVT